MKRIDYFIGSLIAVSSCLVGCASHEEKTETPPRRFDPELSSQLSGVFEDGVRAQVRSSAVHTAQSENPNAVIAGVYTYPITGNLYISSVDVQSRGALAKPRTEELIVRRYWDTQMHSYWKADQANGAALELVRDTAILNEHDQDGNDPPPDNYQGP